MVVSGVTWYRLTAYLLRLCSCYKVQFPYNSVDRRQNSIPCFDVGKIATFVSPGIQEMFRRLARSCCLRSMSTNTNKLKTTVIGSFPYDTEKLPNWFGGGTTTGLTCLGVALEPGISHARAQATRQRTITQYFPTQKQWLPGINWSRPR